MRRLIRAFVAWATSPAPLWTNSRTLKESALALAQMNAEQRRNLLRRAAVKLEKP